MKLSFSCYSCLGSWFLLLFLVISTLILKTNACLEKAWDILKKNVALMGLYAFSLSSLHTSSLTWNALCESGEEYGKKLITLF
jgi:hypothetical protein